MDNFKDFNQQEIIDYKSLLFKLIRHWYLFVLTLIVTMSLAYLFNRYTKPIYEVKTSVLINEDKSKMDPSKMMGLDFMGGDQQNLENEIGKLTSYTLTNQTIKQLHFEVSYYGEGRLLTPELYKATPFIVIIDTAINQPINLSFKVKIIDDNHYTISAEGEAVTLYNYRTYQKLKSKANIKYERELKFGDKVNGTNFSFRIIRNPDFKIDITKYSDMSFVFNNIDALTKQYMVLKIEPINKDASIVEISLRGNNIQKSVDFLNMLTTVYLNRGLEKKNRVAIKTIDFISSQLTNIKDSLNVAEINLQDYRKTNEVMNLDFQSQQAFEVMKDYDTQKAQLDLKNKYYNYLKDYIIKSRNNVDDVTMPSSMGIEDPVLVGLITQLAQLYGERSELLLTAKQKNPEVSAIDSKIATIKSNLLSVINNIVNTSNIAVKDVDHRIALMTARINKLPLTQRLLMGMERKFKVNDEIYTFLLQKLSEAQISKASNMADNEIVDPALSSDLAPVYPKKSLNFTIALLLGFILPILCILGKDYFNDKIIEKEDVEKITKLPILGHILHNNKESKIIVTESPKSSIAESFRSLRTNIQYATQGKDKHIILITSTMPGEGKTFISINLATIYSMYGKKTLLMGFDLRKPKIYHDFGVSNLEGISSFLINKTSLESIIIHSAIPNLDLIMSGPVPPNPAELIASPRTDAFFEQLKQMYDYIIIDTPPIGVVTDAYLLIKHADATVYVVRQNITNKKIFATLIGDIEKRNIPNINILINDVNIQKSGYGYSYGYGYGYGYGAGYYTDDAEKKKSTFFERLFKKS